MERDDIGDDDLNKSIGELFEQLGVDLNELDKLSSAAENEADDLDNDPFLDGWS